LKKVEAWLKAVSGSLSIQKNNCAARAGGGQQRAGVVAIPASQQRARNAPSNLRARARASGVRSGA
jgi:hypothetical protein